MKSSLCNKTAILGWIFAFVLWVTPRTWSQTFNFTTLAGNSGYGIADGTGSDARFQFPQGVAVDASGNVYVADTQNSTIRLIDTSGNVSTLAGLAGNTGSTNGTGSAASFKYPQGITVDVAGNIYVADTGNDLIRMVTPAGIVTTLAGTTGVTGTANGTGTNAQFKLPASIAVDALTNLYVADTYNSTIRSLTFSGSNWVVKTIAGSAGTNALRDGVGTNAFFYQPAGIAVDNAGNLYVADTGNNAIRELTPTPTNFVTTTIAQLNLPTDVSVDAAGVVYVASPGDNTIRKLTHSKTNWDVSIVAGLYGVSGSADGTTTNARFNFPRGLSSTSAGTVYVADTQNNTIREVTAAGAVSTLAGLAGGAGSADGLRDQARFNAPQGLALDAATNLYVADSQNNTIREVTPSGLVITLAGVATNLAGSQDGFGTNASFDSPAAIAVADASTLYVADRDNNLIRELTLSTNGWVVTTLAGRAGSVFLGPITNTVDGQTYISTVMFGNSIYQNYSGTITNISGTTTNISIIITNVPFLTNLVDGHIHTNFLSTNTFTLPPAPPLLDGTGSNALFFRPTGLTLDNSGNLYVADGGTNGIRIVTPDGTVTTPEGFSGAYTVASISTTNVLPFSSSAVAMDAGGNIYIADAVNNAIREMSGGILTTIAGDPGLLGTADGTNSAARFSSPTAITVDAQGNLYVTDTLSQTVREISPSGTNWVVTTVGGWPDVPGSVDGPGSTARFNAPHGITVDGAGNLYVADTGNNTIRVGQPRSSATAVLQVSRDAQQNIIISWPASATGFQLESMPLGGAWAIVTNQPASVGANLVVTNATDTSLRLYRLHKF